MTHVDTPQITSAHNAAGATTPDDLFVTDRMMSIREMCEAFDVTARTLRFYEAKELLFPIREGQRRLFTKRDRARLKLILRGKRFGFSLEDIRQLLDLYDMGDQQQTQLKRTYQIAQDRLNAMIAQRDELTEAIEDLKEQLAWGAEIIARNANDTPNQKVPIRERSVMPHYTAPTKDMAFVLHETLRISELSTRGYADLDADFTSAVLEEAGKLSMDVTAPLNPVGDEQGCTLENGVVRTPDGFKEAFETLAEGGWMGLDMPEEYGGQGMPYIVQTAVGEMFSSANMAFNMYQGLAHGAMSAIVAHGTDAQKQTYLPNMIAGKWGGTMNLTEPHCGTDLGLMRTKAAPQEDGSYKISGQKIWISAGEHDIVDNIVHLVLAKIPGEPDDIKGVSLFIVPKFLVNEDGSLGARNDLSCGGLEKKMGIHGNATCVMNYDGATGYLIGEKNKGMRAMFTMMNEARIGVGLQGYAQGVVAYQNAAAFAQDRLQGRDVTGAKAPEKPADPIIVHPDVRRNLMEQKAFVEGARAFTFWGATMIDQAVREDDAEAEAMISLLTPIIKGFLTDKGFETAVNAQQTLGGSGFTREWGLEQFVRDARITMIYEGTNGVQSLDLVGRKLGLNGGKTVMEFFELVKSFIKDNAEHEALNTHFLTPLKAASKDLQAGGMYFMQNGMKNPNNALSGSYDFMHLFGQVCMGLVWAKMGKAAYAALDAGASDTSFYEAKIATGKYYMARCLPVTATHLARIESGADTVMALEAEQF